MRSKLLSFITTHKNLALLFLVLYFLYTELWVCSYSWCHGFEILLYVQAIVLWVILIVLTHIATLLYNNFIKKISGKIKKTIDITIIILILFISYSFITTNSSRSYLYYKSAILVENPRLCEETFFHSCRTDIAKKTSDPSYCSYEGNNYKHKNYDYLKMLHYKDCIIAVVEKTHNSEYCYLVTGKTLNEQMVSSEEAKRWREYCFSLCD